MSDKRKPVEKSAPSLEEIIAECKRLREQSESITERMRALEVRLIAEEEKRIAREKRGGDA